MSQPNPRELKELYLQGQNIMALLRKNATTNGNTEEIIEVSYDLQAGSYVSALSEPSIAEHKQNYGAAIAQEMLTRCHPTSILEAGVGEATTLAEVVKNLPSETKAYGFDLCWSRLAYGKLWLDKNKIADTTLCTGSLFQIPFSTNSIDVVYTSHSIEPNGGFEQPILQELYRVAKKYLILLEPGYELASAAAKARMDSHRYCKNLVKTAENLGYSVIKHELFPLTANPLNPTAITVIQKTPISESEKDVESVLACPKTGATLQQFGEVLFSPEALCVYPIISGIPCLRAENAIVASYYPELSDLP
ncbi:methyltransferase domain-containing protein [Leptolyngbya iicbica LK]|uniref:Methyltransferase domain-containing protein n=3 Tax=Cyanophyceae TaxID=3028117 RepID=A0A4Q7EML0_9CYAN|nr:methyltransferase domain-containing protein [Leptolyngbya sp. LK]